jgi:MraZ protein
VQLAARGRLVIPEGFREFLGVEPGGDVMIVGAALCVELWQPAAWIDFVHQQMPEFNRLFDELSG